MESLETSLFGGLAFDAGGLSFQHGRVDELSVKRLKLTSGNYAFDASTIQLSGELELGKQNRYAGHVGGTALHVAMLDRQQQPMGAPQVAADSCRRQAARYARKPAVASLVARPSASRA